MQNKELKDCAPSCPHNDYILYWGETRCSRRQWRIKGAKALCKNKELKDSAPSCPHNDYIFVLGKFSEDGTSLPDHNCPLPTDH